MPDELKFYVMAVTECLIGDVYLDGRSPKHDYYHAVFEDDGQTGYLYAYDLRIKEQPILDSIHIYNVHNEEREKLHLFQIVWSADGLKVALFINCYPHAVFDFEAKRGYCRSNFAFPTPEFAKHSHEWTDECLDWFN